MSEQPETRIQKAIVKHLKKLGGHARKVHGSAYSAGEPDIDACIAGRSVKLEVKVPGKKPTPLQLAVLRKWQKAGALAGWVTSLEDVDDLLSFRVRGPGWRNPQLEVEQ